ncbi:helix-turn-helix domain-containing protein [Chitinophaga sp. Cy-1792]|uniref:AraC family transcriptional regulator n=1 Tax=Chitinophaga sp. Cy-1792 TaxID=2608339 RepID=UPI001421CACF|nr:helix-turn-helix domain-containing protein [Chitinophaga sp. Cy-1792]NIG57541.1 AraC family transcriptional regulator [Chitinophaga sp. Cy-1792]
MYCTITPHQLLQPYIDAYWVSSSAHSGRVRILPDTCADIIINAGTTEIYTGSHARTVPLEAFVVGTMTSSSETEHAAGSLLIGIRFNAAGLKAFTGLPLQLITDQHASLQDIAPKWQQQLPALLSPEKNLSGKIKSLENLLLQHLPGNNINTSRILYATSLIRNAGGSITTAMLADKTNTGLRNFERQFLDHTGVSAKTFSRIVRFMRLEQLLRKGYTGHLLALALDMGYYDHAHLTHEFRQFAGVSPEQFRHR